MRDSGQTIRHSPSGRRPDRLSASLAMRAPPNATLPGWLALPVKPTRRPPAMPPSKPPATLQRRPRKRPALPRSPGRRPMTSYCKPNARRPAMPAMPRPAMPAMPLARHGLEKDNAPCEQVRGPTGGAAPHPPQPIVPSLNFHYTTFCRPGGGRDPGPGWIPAFAGMTNRTGLLGFQPCSLVTSFARQHTSAHRHGA